MDDGGRIQTATAAEASGNGGAIDVRVGKLILTDGSQLDSGTRGIGRGGDVVVVATESISIAGRDRSAQLSALRSDASGRGQGGNVEVVAPHLQLSDGGAISARSTGASDAGSITIQAGKLFLIDNSVVTTQAEQGDGGNILLTAGSLVDLRDSQITATVRSGVGQGGNITIELPSVVLERSQIRANAFGGPGGSVQIMADVLLKSPERPEL